MLWGPAGTSLHTGHCGVQWDPRPFCGRGGGLPGSRILGKGTFLPCRPSGLLFLGLSPGGSSYSSHSSRGLFSSQGTFPEQWALRARERWRWPGNSFQELRVWGAPRGEQRSPLGEVGGTQSHGLQGCMAAGQWVVGWWVASPGVPGSHPRGLGRARCPGFGFRRFCLAAVLGVDWRPQSEVREAEAGEEADAVTPAGKLFRPVPGEGREAPGSRVLGEVGAGLVVTLMWGNEEGAPMSGSGSGGAGGAHPDLPLGLKVCCWPAARGRPGSPSGLSGICPDRGLRDISAPPRCVLCLPLSFLLFFRSLADHISVQAGPRWAKLCRLLRGQAPGHGEKHLPLAWDSIPDSPSLITIFSSTLTVLPS